MSDPTFVVTCPSCGVGNRIPAGREGQQGRCGSCKSLLPPVYYQPQQLTAAGFDRFVDSYPGPVLAEFWTPT